MALSQDDLKCIEFASDKVKRVTIQRWVRDPFFVSPVLAGHPEDVVYLKITKYTS